MAKFYLKMGLVITKIYKISEFYPMKCFEVLGNRIAENRHLDDRDPYKQILALTVKLLGNSFYSASLFNKNTHCQITYFNNSNMNKTINLINWKLYKQICMW